MSMAFKRRGFAMSTTPFVRFIVFFVILFLHTRRMKEYPSVPIHTEATSGLVENSEGENTNVG